MMNRTVLSHLWVRIAIVVVLIAAGLGAMALPPVRDTVHGLFAAKAEESSSAAGEKNDGAELIDMGENQGLRLSDDAQAGLGIEPVAAIRATSKRALPPQPGTVNFDIDGLYPIRSRFPGEVAEIGQTLNTDDSITPTRSRPLRPGDKVKPGDLLAVVWSQQLGMAKAALVDAISAVRLSQENLKKHEELFTKGAIPEATLRADERLAQQDTNTLLTAERSLKFWKLAPPEINEIKTEAKIIAERKKVRSADDEANWARVEIRVPPDKANPNREFVIVEKNTNVIDMVDPINSPPLFRLADTSRLQIWVHPPEEYVPIIRDGLQRNGGLKLQWSIRFQADPPETPPQILDIVQIGPSLEPNQHTPMVFGYLPNPEGKYLIGQFVTATIYVAPDENTVEIPTNALNEVEGQGLVFVQDDPAKHEYSLRRVAVVSRFKDVTFVRSQLTEADKKTSKSEVERGRRPLQALQPGQRVVTRGVVELTAALEDLATKRQVARNMADSKKP